MDMAEDTILAGSNRQEKPVSLFSYNMRKKISDIEFESSNARDRRAGDVFGARFSKDSENSVIFACGAGKNEFRVFDNDTTNNGTYRNLGSFGNYNEAFFTVDTSPSGRLVAMGTSQGHVYISSYDFSGLD